MKRYYLIDYENVHESGLKGCANLTSDDVIMLFFTQNAVSLDMRAVANHGGSELKMIQVDAGKQSADMHIASYVGKLIGEKTADKIIIISNDKGYNKIIEHWKKKYSIDISRAERISKGTTQNGAQKTQTKKVNDKKHEKNNEIISILSKVGYPNETATKVASIVANNFQLNKPKQPIYRAIVSNFGQSDGQKLYGLIKKYI